MTRLARIAAVAALAVGSLGLAAPARADNITVNVFHDELNTDGDCSLREANQAAYTNVVVSGCAAGTPGADVILLPPGTYTLSPAVTDNDLGTGDIDINAEIVTFQPSAPGGVVIDAGAFDRAFEVKAGSEATMRDLTITNGDATSGSGSGGGVLVGSGAVLTMERTTVRDSVAKSSGGAIHTFNGAVTLRNVTLSGNTAEAFGGAITGDSNHSTTLNNVTVTNNTADSDGDGFGDGGGIADAFNAGVFSVRNTIIAGNRDLSPGTTRPDCSDEAPPRITSQGHNLVQTPSDCAFAGPGDITGQPANLGPLQHNGGTTPTHELLVGSRAIDAGNPASPDSGGAACEATDQRGVARPQGTRCDIGAFERVPPPAIPGGRCAGRSATHQGTDLNDVVTGTEGDDVFVGLNGADTFKGLGGNDIACGGSGNDKLKGGGGADRLNGQGGNDRLAGQGGRDVLKGGGDNDRMSGGGGRDSCLGGGGRDRGSACEGTRSLP